MPFLIALGGLLLLAVVFGPQLWVRHILKKHSDDRPDLPGNGADLARHLLDEAGLQHVKVGSPRACWTACDTSCAATATAAIERPSWCGGVSRTASSSGS